MRGTCRRAARGGGRPVVMIRYLTLTALVPGWIESHPGTAAWVQAVGTILALVIAIVVPVFRVARTADHLRRRRFLSSVASIGGEAQECFADAAMRCARNDLEGRAFVRSVEAFHRFQIASQLDFPQFRQPYIESRRVDLTSR
jgi:hypothetical protein